MSAILFDLFDNMGFTKKGEVNQEAIANADITALISAAEQSVLVTENSELREQKGIFAHSASLSMGGGLYPCSSLGYREARVAQLAQFAALYSDRVYIHNFFTDLVDQKDFLTTTNRQESFQHDFYNNLVILEGLRPLIESGRVVLFTSVESGCIHHLAQANFGPDADKRLSNEQARLVDLYLNQTTVFIKMLDDRYYLSFRAPELLLDHGQTGHLLDNPPFDLSAVTGLKEKLNNEETVQLPKRVVKRFNLHKPLVGAVFRNIKYELATAQSLGTSYLTEMPLHVEILNSLSEDIELEAKNRIVQKHLSAILPFVGDLAVADLVKLRNREEEAFILYRSALNKAIDTIQRQKSGLTEGEAKTIYLDIIQPKLTVLDQRVKSSKRDMIKSGLISAIGWGAAISFGMYQGFVPEDLKAAATALGLTGLVANTIKTLGKQTSSEASIRSDELYFLWKARQMVE